MSKKFIAATTIFSLLLTSGLSADQVTGSAAQDSLRKASTPMWQTGIFIGGLIAIGVIAGVVYSNARGPKH